MKRLLDVPASDRLTERAHLLIRATGPTVESEARLRRVRRSLDGPNVQAPRWAFRFALIAGLLGASAVAAAAGGALVGVFDAAQPASSVSALPAVPQPRAPAPAPAAPRSIPEATSASPPPLAAPAPAPALPEARGAASDVARVHEAAKALRHDRDPARALKLLERSPIVGPLAEEALALRIEASMALGGERAKRLAAGYLAQYPSGRYRELAKRALAGSDR